MKRIQTIFRTLGIVGFLLLATSCDTSNSDAALPEISFVVTDALQTSCYDNDGDKTITDNHTGFMWQQTPPTRKMTYDEAIEYVEDLTIGGFPR